MTNVEAFYILEASYIDRSVEQAVEDYGSMAAYIRDGLGITDELVEPLRSQLLRWRRRIHRSNRIPTPTEPGHGGMRVGRRGGMGA